MSKNVLFLLKISQNCQTLGSQSPDPLASGGWVLRPQTPLQSTYIFNSSFCICPQKHRLFRNQPKSLFSCNYCVSALGFWRRKNYAAFRMPKTTDIITIDFNFFVLSPHSFFAGVATVRTRLGVAHF